MHDIRRRILKRQGFCHIDTATRQSKMWLSGALLVLATSWVLAEKAGQVTVKPISIDDIKHSEIHKAANFESHGVARHIKNSLPDPHHGNAKIEGLLHQYSLVYLKKSFKSREKDRLHHTRRSQDTSGKRSSGRYRRDVEGDTVHVRHGNIRHKRFMGTWMLWENNVIPYEWGNVTIKEKDTAKSAMELIKNFVCVDFVEYENTDAFRKLHDIAHNDRIIFVTEGNQGCWSQVGHVRNEQYISACDSLSTALHELFHVLGAFHEHESYDREGNIEENLQNVLEEYKSNFYKHDPAYKSFFNVDKYDIQSLMHYGAFDFSANGLPTLDPLYPDIAEPAEDYWLLLKEMSKVYKCLERKCPGTDLVCENEGYASYVGGKCKCVCPEGLDEVTNCRTVIDTGCGGVIELSADKRSEVIKLPDPINQFTGLNVTCHWIFKSPGRVQLDIRELELAGTFDGCDETLTIRRNLLGQSGAEYCGEGFEASVFSTGNYLGVTVKAKALSTGKFIAAGEVLLEEESCYNWADRGESYNGALDRSINHYKCVNWTEATICNHSPFSYDGELKADYSGNECRNPGGVLHGPWCYTEVRPTSCTIKYCEPCQTGSLYDVYDNCDDILDRFPDFCDDEEALHGCRFTCEMKNPIIVSGKCGPPPGPDLPDATMTTLALLNYKAGDSVTYQCNSDRTKVAKRWCMSTGEWTHLSAVCGECVDQITTCMKMLQRNHTLCINTPEFSSKYCASTCGTCIETPVSCDVPQPAANSNVQLMTSSSVVAQGQLAVYACKTGFFPASGDKELVCTGDGTLLGEMLKCSGNDQALVKVSDLEIQQLQFETMANWFVLGKHRYTIIEKDGALKAWYFYCINAGKVILAVFRDTDVGFQVVGVTKTECDAARENVRQLDALTEIHVKKGDYIGAFDETGGCLTYTMCEDPTIVSEIAALDQAQLETGTNLIMSGFPLCLYLAVNADIGPSSTTKYKIVNYFLQNNVK